jgi:DnaJ-class molecular chaperone
VPTPGGVVSLAIPPGSSSGRKLRLKGQGIQSASAPAGDLIVTVQIKVPESLDDESKALLQQFAEKNPQSLRHDLSF